MKTCADVPTRAKIRSKRGVLAMKPSEKAKKVLCMAIATVPWAILVVLMAIFGVVNVLVTIVALFGAISVLSVVILFVRACGLELYERVFERKRA